MIPRGSLYGLAKVHEKDIPVRPAPHVAEWLSVVPECKINCKTGILEEDEIIISFECHHYILMYH